MTIALIDNGSVEPAAHRALRLVAADLGTRTGHPVHTVSWKHSNRIAADLLDGTPAVCLPDFVARNLAAGERGFLFIPFFISAQGAIGSSLRRDLETLQAAATAAPFTVAFTDGLGARGAIAPIVADRIRTRMAERALVRPPVIVVDHGGPSPASAAVRNTLTDEVRSLLGDAVGPVAAASMEGDEHPHNHPVLADQLRQPGFDRGDVIIAPLFLLPGRHAGPAGDLAEIADAAMAAAPAPLRCHFTGLVGDHPRAAAALAQALRDATSSLQPH
jgi:sirohydrochlorin ferrochelatase